MKQLIKQFERESNLDVYSLGLDRVKWEDRLRAYTELVVRECANVAADHDALDIYEEIREHFKVTG